MKHKSQSTKTSKRGYAGISSERRDEMRRSALIESGIVNFGTIGYAATTIEALCSEARVSTRDFYAYFGSKEDLLLAVYDRIIAETLQAVITKVNSAPDGPAESARAGIEAFVNAMVRDERWARINFIEVVGVSQRVELRRREAIHGFAELLNSFAEPMAAKGLVDPVVISSIRATALVGAVHETLTDWVVSEQRPPLELIVSELVALYVAATRG